MVFYYTCSDPTYMVYIGKDKYENEGLIRWGWEEDLWFHVDALSSAHVYLRVPFDHPMKDGRPDASLIPKEVIEECLQITKHNSIEGCKKSSVDVVCTPWSNLQKAGDMDVGQVGFKKEKYRHLFRNVERKREMLRNLEKSKTEQQIDLMAERERRDRDVQKREADVRRAEEKQRQQELARRAEEKKLRTYQSLFEEGTTANNVCRGDGTFQTCKALEEDFM
ncbi:MAG: uncharacterized protein KVP18_003140 [Porospora cf. gigantea A]|uniref:uncharacterized protein n=1 Tax=Porospora cf. gigantea A TaxID=2853593 RepID=UPI003559A945|nr:MAG: hypothetical protein KVP18_003140 [Porospora cf. gigantea A]